MFKDSRLVTYCAEKAAAHFFHHAIGTALLLLVLSGAEVNACAAGQASCVASDVWVKPAEFVRQECDTAQAHVVSLGHGVGQKVINLFANSEGLFQ
ncbi:hypothetical protein [Comamonas terrigena]|uniref:hypothetical protein n=1 Tax=Comamonas terrigena TaxID=32013 RepID=UPI0028AB3B92|nr:hypothetical protein [Comamonas terrigena]